MKRFLVLVIFFAIVLCSCSQIKNESETPGLEAKTSLINHCVVEPDKSTIMNNEDRENYSILMQTILNQGASVKLSKDSKRNNLYLDLLKRSPYYFFVKDYIEDGQIFSFSYIYSKKEQDNILSFMDEKFLEHINYKSNTNDNTLDKILKIYESITKTYEYDYSRKDSHQLDSPLFTYPSDEIYKAMKEKKCLCFGYANILQFCLAQIGVDCFKVYGFCRKTQEAHMWNIIKYDNEFFNCDAGWDITSEGYSKLFHFGKTDDERFSDTIDMVDFSLYHEKEYGEVLCTDERFKIFRGISRYSSSGTHEFYMQDIKNREYYFSTQTFQLNKY